MEGLGFISELPQGCITEILSLTSPQEACKSSTVSAAFREAADSDLVWERFLPSDYREIVARVAGPPVRFSSKKELFMYLCNPIRVDGHNKIFTLEKPTGRKSFILPARELSITWGNDPMYWSWRPDPESRFTQVAELRTVCWLEITGKIGTQMLTPNTTYGAYLIVKIADRAYGLDAIPSQIGVSVAGAAVSSGTFYLSGGGHEKKAMMESLIYSNRMEMLQSRVVAGDGGARRLPARRGDGWVEVELGEFWTGDGGCDEEVRMSLTEVKGHQLKGGLIVEGLEIRPKH